MEVRYSTAFKVLDKRLSATVKNAVRTCGTDLLRVAQARAPVASKTLERSGNLKVSNSSSQVVANVTFKASHKGYNYAKRMDETRYLLGEGSLAKSASGVRSRFCSESLPVGTGYLSGTAKACEEGYREYVSKELDDVILTGGFR